MSSHSYYEVANPLQSKCGNTIEVLGEGAAVAIPDRAVVVLGAVTEGPVLNAVQTDNAKTVTKIINSILQVNIPREKIKTHDYRIEVQYDYQDGKQIFRGYKVTHLLQIVTDRVGETGKLIDTAVSNGANNVTSIQFTMAQPEIYKNQALLLAIQNAQQKAATIANTLKVALAAVPSQVQEHYQTNKPLPFTTSLHVESAVTPIEPGQLTIYAAVRVWYLFG
jgi:uncharacterized protein YggE